MTGISTCERIYPEMYAVFMNKAKALAKEVAE